MHLERNVIVLLLDFELALLNFELHKRTSMLKPGLKKKGELAFPMSDLHKAISALKDA